MSELVELLRANAREPSMTIGGKAWALDAANEIETALNAIVGLHAEVELYRSRWLSCVTPEEAERLRDAMQTARSLLRGLPASRTATDIDKILANALGES